MYKTLLTNYAEDQQGNRRLEQQSHKLTDFYRELYPTVAEYTVFSSALDMHSPGYKGC